MHRGCTLLLLHPSHCSQCSNLWNPLLLSIVCSSKSIVMHTDNFWSGHGQCIEEEEESAVLMAFDAGTDRPLRRKTSTRSPSWFFYSYFQSSSSLNRSEPIFGFISILRPNWRKKGNWLQATRARCAERGGNGRKMTSKAIYGSSSCTFFGNSWQLWKDMAWCELNNWKWKQIDLLWDILSI